LGLNLSDVEDSWSTATAQYQEVIAEFEAEWMRPMVEMMLAMDIYLNQDIYLGGAENGNDSNLYGNGQAEEAEGEEGPATGIPYD
jgi:hypothetical protein